MCSGNFAFFIIAARANCSVRCNWLVAVHMAFIGNSNCLIVNVGRIMLFVSDEYTDDVCNCRRFIRYDSSIRHALQYTSISSFDARTKSLRRSQSIFSISSTRDQIVTYRRRYSSWCNRLQAYRTSNKMLRIFHRVGWALLRCVNKRITKFIIASSNLDLVIHDGLTAVESINNIPQKRYHICKNMEQSYGRRRHPRPFSYEEMDVRC
jgi:hypothetical protein